MNSPLSKTLIMAVMAVATSAAAAYFYPWPVEIAQSAIVGNPLFETYDSSSVRQIRIVKFNDDRGGLDQILLRRKGEKWIVPAKKDFIAGNARQISMAASSLIESTVLQDVTDEQQAYLEFGVVDPDQYLSTPNRSALGTKIILQDRDLKEIASLIIGTPVKDDSTRLQHFVRIPGQPNVYVINFNAAALQTDFRSWIDPNLFDLSDPALVNTLQVENYKINSEPTGTGAPQFSYRADAKLRIRQNQVLVDLVSLEIPQGDGQWTKAALTPEMSQQFQPLGLQSAAIYYPDVQLKDQNLANALLTPLSEVEDSVFESMKPYGFMKTGFENGTFEFDAVGGEVSVETTDGVIITLYIGGIAEKSDTSDLQLNYYVMLCAGVNESVLPEPEKPADADEKAYLRLVEERNDKLKAARLRADSLNQRHAPWYYIVTQDVVSNLRPDIDTGASSTTNPASAPDQPASSVDDPKPAVEKAAAPGDSNSDQ